MHFHKFDFFFDLRNSFFNKPHHSTIEEEFMLLEENILLAAVIVFLVIWLVFLVKTLKIGKNLHGIKKQIKLKTREFNKPVVYETENNKKRQ